MKDFRSITRRIVGLGALLAAATLSACSDASTGPDEVSARSRSGYLTTSAAVRRFVDINFSVLYPTLSIQYPVKSAKADTTVETFTVDNTKGSIVIIGSAASNNIIAMPAQSLCDPAKNSYGPSEWKKACVLATAPVTFTVKNWKDAAGHPHAEFQPAMRFVPDDTKPVRLYFQDAALENFSVVYIPYCNAANVCVNEGLTDPALETYVSPLLGGGYWVYRTLRHFSGYNVTAY